MNDEVAQLQRVFDIDELPRSTVDLGRAVRAGRRRERLRGVAVAGTAVVAVLAVVATIAVIDQKADRSRQLPAGQVGSAGPWKKPGPATSSKPGPVSPPLGTCTYKTLAIPGITGTFEMDPSGRIIAGMTAESGGDVIRLTDGHSERISPPGGGNGSVIAVNRGGDFLIPAGGKFTLYHGGTFTPVPEPADTIRLSATDVNDHGAVAVEIGTAGHNRILFEAAVWPADHPAGLTVLDTPPGWESRATAINNDGVVAGWLERSISETTTESERTPVYWDKNGVRHDLPVPAGATDTAMTDMAGDWLLARGIRWNLRTGGVDLVNGILAEQIDAEGRVFGEVPDMAPPHPGTWINGAVTLLPIDPATPLGMMGQVSEDGRRIIGRTSSETAGRQLDWTCR